jgi:hypothetical protein
MIKIGFDIDSVWVDFAFDFSREIRDMFGNNCPVIATKEEVKAWDWSKWYPGLSASQIDLVWKKIIAANNWWEFSTPKADPGTLDWLEFYRNSPDVDFFFITSRVQTAGDSIIKQTYRWFYKNFNFKTVPIIVGANKGEICKALRLDYYIDDSPEMVLDVHRKCLNFTKTYIMDYPYNRNLNLPRVNNLREFFETVTEDLYGTTNNKI